MQKMEIFQKFRQLSDKDRILFQNILGAFAVKGLSLVVSLFTLPAYMRFFKDQNVLGVWYTVLSVLTWVLNFDLGVGNGLRNKLALALAVNDQERARQVISSAYFMIGGLMLVLTAAGLTLIPLADWNGFFNVEADLISGETLAQVVRYAFIGIALQFFLRLISSILYALQKSAVNDAISLVTSVLLLTFALLAPAAAPADSLKLFSLGYVFCANLPLAVATVMVFWRPLKKCRPGRRWVNVSCAKGVLSLGGMFFFCQIFYMVIANTNEFFITQYTDPTNVVEYQIYNKLFTLVGTIFMLGLTPVWSAVSRAVAEEDYLWLRRVKRQLLWLTAAAAAAEFAILPFLQILVDLWLGPEAIAIQYDYALIFALFGTAMIAQSTVSVIANGTGRIKLQMLCYGLGVVVKVVVIDLGCRLTGEWIVVVLANALVLLPYCILQQLDLTRYIRRKLSEKQAGPAGV